MITHDGQKIAAAIFRPQHDQLATAGSDLTVCLWEIPTGKRLFQTPPFRSQPYALAFSGDGRWLAVSLADKTVMLLDAVTGELKRDALPHPGPALPVFDSSGEFIATQPDGFQRAN